MFEIAFAILAGVLTIASPCILPLLPILLGTSLGKSGKARPMFIVLGFIISFTFAAAILSLLVQRVGLNGGIFRNIGIIVLALFGILLIWPKPFEMVMLKATPFISDVSKKAGTGRSGNTSAFILGLTLGLVWTPCAGPVLASILVLIALQKNILASLILLVAYSIGAGVPMVIIAYGGQYVSKKVKTISKYTHLLQQIFGIFIVLLAVAMYFNIDTKIYAEILSNYPIFNPKF